MTRLILSCVLLMVVKSGVSAEIKPNQPIEYAIAIHGGAGAQPKTKEWKRNREQVLEKALQAGSEILKQNGASLDAVEIVIRILEDSPFFNAGKGAVFNADGRHELDASIMDGKSRQCGAVGGVRTIRHPISLARRVMSDTKHILLVTDGAEKFATELTGDKKIEIVPNQFFSTPHQRDRLLRVRGAQTRADSDAMGTVGCVALDRAGNLAAGTSTGGLVNKKFGRVGDSPLIGAGTFADNGSCAVSATGIGVDFIRNAVCYDVSARVKYRGDRMQDAIREILKNPEIPVRGGLIGVSASGQISIEFNTQAMARAAADSTGRWWVEVGSSE